MRNIMLAATALVGMTALTAGYASAQTAEPTTSTDSFNSGLASGATLAPSTITVRLRASMWNELSYVTDTAQKTAGGKNSGVLLGSFMRLYPKFDGKAANGLEYGATAEVRMNSGGAGNSSTSNTLYWRRYNGYVGTPTLGRLYIGPENNALARLAAGSTMEDFDYNGGFNGNIVTGASGNVTLSQFPFMRGGSFYTTNKIVYVSPSFAGFTFGGSWEPSQSTGDLQVANGSVLGPQSASTLTGANVRRNTMDATLQYKGSFGPVAVTAFVGYLTGGHVVSNSTPSAQQFKDPKQLATGGRLTIGPFAVGGQFNTGDLNYSNLALKGARRSTNIVAGAQYTIGSVIFGAQYINTINAGNVVPTNSGSTAHDRGVIVGGAWDYAPGATLYADVMYSQRSQAGWNINAGAAGNAGNTAQARGIQVGNVFRW